MRKIQDRSDGMAVSKDSMSRGSPGAISGGSTDADGSFARVADGSIGRSGDGAPVEISWRRDSISDQSTAGSALRVNTTRPIAHALLNSTYAEQVRSHSKSSSQNYAKPRRAVSANALLQINSC